MSQNNNNQNIYKGSIVGVAAFGFLGATLIVLVTVIVLMVASGGASPFASPAPAASPTTSPRPVATPTGTATPKPLAATVIVIGGGPTPTPALTDIAPPAASVTDTAPAALATNTPPSQAAGAADTPSPAAPTATSTSPTVPTAIAVAGGVEGGSWLAAGGGFTYNLPDGADTGSALGPVTQLPANPASLPITVSVTMTSAYGEDCGIAIGDPQSFTLATLRGGKSATWLQLASWGGEGNFSDVGAGVQLATPYIATPHQLALTSSADGLSVTFDGHDGGHTPPPAGRTVMLYAAGNGCNFSAVEVTP